MIWRRMPTPRGFPDATAERSTGPGIVPAFGEIAMRHRLTRFAAAALVSIAGLASAQPSGVPAGPPPEGVLAADFVIPDRATEVSVADPESIREVVNDELIIEAEARKVYSGETTDDAIRHVIEKVLSDGGGAEFIKTDSGLGIVAKGVASYDPTQQNRNLLLREQRHAWVTASLRARQQLVETLRGADLSARTLLVEQRRERDGGTQVQLENVQQEEWEIVASGFLRGVVTYQVSDDPATGQVMVSVVATPRSMGIARSVGGGVGPITAQTLTDGLNKAFADIRNGTVPATGGTVVIVPTTGEVAWVGFGFEPLPFNDNPRVQQLLRDDAYRIAGERADIELVRVIKGEYLEASSQTDERTREVIDQIRELDDEFAGDPAAAGEREARAAIAERSVIAERTRASSITTQTEGTVPPGRQQRVYELVDAEGEPVWVYAVSVYFGTAKDLGDDLRRQMQEFDPLRAAGRNELEYLVSPDGTFEVSPEGNLIPLGNGRVTDPGDL